MSLDVFADLTALFDDFNDRFRSKHRVSFTCSAHTVGKDGSVETLCEKFDSFLTSVVVHFLLRGLYKDIIEGVLQGVHVLPLVAGRARSLHTLVLFVKLPLRYPAIGKGLFAFETNDDLDGVARLWFLL